jgi:iron(III) transport system permease protein
MNLPMQRAPTLGAVVESLFGWAAAAIVILPLVFLCIGAVGSPSTGWTHLATTVLPELIWSSLVLAIGVAIGVALLGTIPAWLVANFEFPGRRLLEWLLVLPLAVPAYVMAYVYTDLLQYAGPLQSMLREFFGWQSRHDYYFPEIRSAWGAVCVLTLALYPYVYVLARVAFLEQSSSLVEAGRSAGLSRLKVFWRISIPVARPAIAAGIALAAMETLADFGTVSYFGVQTLTTGIFKTWFSEGNLALASQLAMLLVMATAICLMIEHRSRSRARFHQVATRAGNANARIRSRKRWWAAALCAAPLALGFVLPVALLLRMALREAIPFDAQFAGLAMNSFGLAATAAVLAVACAVTLAFLARGARSRAAALANRIASTGYAIPGMVIAVGILIPATLLDRQITGWLESITGRPWPLLLSGSIALLVYAYLVRFLGIALQSTEAGLAKITPRMEDAARSLGSGPLRTLICVHLPLLRGSLLMALLLVFVDVLKELPATLVMRPFNFDTLAVRTYTLAMDERLGEAAWPALLIVAVAAIPVFIAARSMVSARNAGPG